MQINKGRLTLETKMRHVCLCGKVRVRGRASKVRKPSQMWEVEREQQIQALSRISPASIGPATCHVLWLHHYWCHHYSLGSRLQALSVTPILPFFNLQCLLDWHWSCYVPSHHPIWYLGSHCTWNSSTKLQNVTPGTTDTLKWKSSEPCGKSTPGH